MEMEMEMQTKASFKSISDIDLTVEFIENGDLSGIFIDSEGPERIQTHFLPCFRSDIEEWIIKNGSEDEDYRIEADWFDSEGGNGWNYPVYILTEDSFDNNLKKYAIEYKSEWIQGGD
jgi:hypothetical protein